MTKFAAIALVAALAAMAASSVFAGSLVAPAGYTCTDTVLSIAADGWFGGFDFLPNGNFVISDGYAIREITLAGEQVSTLYTYEDPDPSTPDVVDTTFGSFVRYNAANNRVYFGESTFGTVRWVSLDGGVDSLVATLPYNYDMDLWDSVPYVVSGSKVYRVNESSGTVEAVASVAGPSGPMVFDSAGNLVYGTGDWDWSTTNDQNIYLWSAAQVAGAGTGNVLEADSAVLLAANVNGPGGFTFSPLGELLYTDSIGWPACIQLVRNGTPEVFAETCVPDQFPYTTTLRRGPAGEIAAAVSWSVKVDGRWVTSSVISTLTETPAVPEPSSVLALSSLIGLVASARLLRRGR